MTSRTIYLILRAINRLSWPLILPILGGIWLFSPKNRLHFRERLGLSGGDREGNSGMRILFHLASLGEAHAAIPLIEDLSRKTPLVLTTTTLTGREALKKQFPDLPVFLAPVDLPDLWVPFLKSRKIAGILLFETEIWPSMLASALNLGIRVGVVNGRLSTKGFNRIRRFRTLFSPLLNSFAPVLVQTPIDAERYQILGVSPESIQIVGNIKWDIPDPCGGEKPDSNLEKWLAENENRFVVDKENPTICRILLSSFHPPETDRLLEAFKGWQRSSSVRLHLIVAPRHLDKINDFRQFLPSGVSFRSGQKKDVSLAMREEEILISFLDSYGELRKLTCLCDIAVIGGTLDPVGGHTPIDAAAAGIPMICGPYVDHILGLVDELEKQKALIRIKNAAEVRTVVESLVNIPSERQERGKNARQVFESMKGSRQKTLDALINFVPELSFRNLPEKF